MNIVSRRQHLAALAGICVAPAPAAAKARSQVSQLERMAQAVVARGAAPGLSFGVVRWGQAPTLRTYGLANIETETRVSSASVFRVGSITKQFVAAALLKAQDDGKLDLNDSVTRFVDEVPAARGASVLQLLNHTSGLTSYTEPQPKVLDLKADRTTAGMLDLIARLAPAQQFRPGEGWAYSNSGYFLAGAVLERIYGDRLQVVLRRMILDPLALTNTDIDDAATVVKHRVSGYSPGSANPREYRNAEHISMSLAGGAGALRSTPEDLLNWSQMLWTGKVLSREALRQMCEPARLSHGELASSRFPVEATGMRGDYALGVVVAQTNNGLRVGHGGTINGFQAAAYSYPEAGLSYAVAANADLALEGFSPGFESLMFGDGQSKASHDG